MDSENAPRPPVEREPLRPADVKGELALLLSKMLPKSRRMPRELFTELLTKSQFVNSPHFSLRFRLSSENARIGVSVSKKISKSAVVRNSIRRRVYSSVQTLTPNLPKGLFLFVAKVGAASTKGEKLASELENLLKQATI